MWFLIGLIAIALIAGIFWSYKKKQDKRTAERARQFEVLLSELKRNPQLAASGAAGATAPAVTAPVPAVSPGLGKKARLLPQSGALLYFVFRTGLPDHEIFANLTLADLVDIEPTVRGYEREQKARRLAQQRLDLVICTKQLEVVAAVLLDTGTSAGAAQAGNAEFIELCLQAGGIRLVRVDAAAPPRHHQVRDLVYGAG
jgi:hypothetical protein